MLRKATQINNSLVDLLFTYLQACGSECRNVDISFCSVCYERVSTANDLLQSS